jgi:adenylylsulfate kinase-like enzyme
MKKINKGKGILFWITGLSGAGKTTIANKIKKDISKIYGPTLMISGDNIRSIFDLRGYGYKDRLEVLKKYTKFAKYITNQKINLIFAVVGMVETTRRWNRKNIDNYVEIFIKSKIKNIKNLNKKKIYHKKNSKNVIGLDIKAEFPKKPDITIINSFNKSTDALAKKLLKKINDLLIEKF